MDSAPTRLPTDVPVLPIISDSRRAKSEGGGVLCRRRDALLRAAPLPARGPRPSGMPEANEADAAAPALPWLPVEAGLSVAGTADEAATITRPHSLQYRSPESPDAMQ